MFSLIANFAGSDEELLRFLEHTLEYADIYSLAKKRQRGCDGMGDLAMVREELRDSIDGLLTYCKRKGHLSGDIRYDIDSAADALCNLAVNQPFQRNSD